METVSDIKELSHSQISAAIHKTINDEGMGPYKWLRDIYDSYAIIECGDHLYRQDYSVTDDEVTLSGEPQEVVISYTSVGKKAVLKAETRNALSDADFAYIDSKGGRHLPIHDATHARNALARFNQTDFESDAAKKKALKKIHAAAKRHGVEVSEGDKAMEPSGGLRGKMMAMMVAIQDMMHSAQHEEMDGGMDDMNEPQPAKKPAAKKPTPVIKTSRKDFTISPVGGAFKSFTDVQGKQRWMSWTSNSFADNDGEIFTQKAHEENCDWMNKGNHGALWIGHLPVKIGTPDAHIMLGRFLVETGTFDDTKDGKKAAEYFAACEDPLEVSHGYLYKKSDRDDGIYEWLRIGERSVLPKGVAANSITTFGTLWEEQSVAEKGLREKVKDLFIKALGEERFTQLQADTESLTKAMEDSGMDFKALSDEPKPEPKDFVLDETAIKAISEAVTASLKADTKVLDEKLAALPTRSDLEALTKRLEALEATDEAKTKARLETLPRITAYRATQDPATLVTDADKLVAAANKQAQTTERTALEGMFSVFNPFLGGASNDGGK